MGVSQRRSRQLAPGDPALAYPGLRTLRPGALRTPSDQPPAPCGECHAALCGAEVYDRRDLAELCRRPAVWRASAASGVGGLDRRTQGCVEHDVLDAHALGLQPQRDSPKSNVQGPPTASRITHHVSRYYLLSLFFFALGLMSKPMLVTLPCVLLLLDYWPLGRLRLETARGLVTSMGLD